MTFLAQVQAATARRLIHQSAPAGPMNVIPLILDGNHTYNAAAPVNVSLVDGTYRSSIAAGDSALTTHFNADRGRIDGLVFTGPFAVRFSNIGILYGATYDDYQFCGAIVSNLIGIPPFGPNYMFSLPGQRGPTGLTLEFKNTNQDISMQDDVGQGAIPSGRADILVVRDVAGVRFYYRQPGQTDDDWILLPHASLANHPVPLNESVIVGIVTYGAYWIEEFGGGCDEVVVLSGSYV